MMPARSGAIIRWAPETDLRSRVILVGGDGVSGITPPWTVPATAGRLQADCGKCRAPSRRRRRRRGAVRMPVLLASRMIRQCITSLKMKEQ